MKQILLRVAAAAALFVAAASTSQAQIVLLYSFETIAPGGGPPGPDGFFGLGAAVTQDTIGATHLLNSMKYDVSAGQGFVGARTEIVPPQLNNPPGVLSILCDITIPVAYAGTFADMGVTVFGHDIDNGVFGIQNQFTDTISLASLGAGTHLNQKIDLDSEFNSGQSFNQIFGDDVSDLDVASAFQFYISKNGGAGGSPITLYIDNVRIVVPEPASLLTIASAGGLLLMRRRRQG